MLTLYVTFHSLGFVVWTGMGLLLPLVILPMIRRMDESQRVKMMAEITRKFLPWFIAAGLVVGLTGWVQTFLLFDAYGHQPYIYIKHVVVLLLVIVSVILWFWWAPKFFNPKGDPAVLWRWLDVLAWLQLVLSLGTLVMCAVMITV
jgi:uncharacterized membrane protein